MKLRLIFVPLIVFTYLVFTPVFVHLEYGMYEEVQTSKEDVYYSMISSPNRSFNYYLMYATSKAVIKNTSFDFWIQDYKNTMRQFEIKEITAIIDGETIVIETVSNAIMVLQKPENMYSKQFSEEYYNFTLPKVPINNIVVKVNGVASYDDGTSKNIIININQTIETKEYVTTLIGYYIDLLRF